MGFGRTLGHRGGDFFFHAAVGRDSFSDAFAETLEFRRKRQVFLLLPESTETTRQRKPLGRRGRVGRVEQPEKLDRMALSHQLAGHFVGDDAAERIAGQTERTVAMHLEQFFHVGRRGCLNAGRFDGRVAAERERLDRVDRKVAGHELR